MDFFEHQEIARRRTTEMVIFYCLAVVLIVVAVYLAVMFIFTFGARHADFSGSVSLWNPVVFLWVSICTGAVILLGTLYKIHALSDGGQTVAEMLGGRLIEPGTADANERRLMNVVEEMALASGMPVPHVYVLEDEPGINAFAAGFTRSDAVIAVTRGTVDNLNRDQLQGVVAHEFSHILNGDMRLNIRLIGVLNGILVIALIGYWLMRSVRTTRSSRGKGGGAVAAIFLFGVAMMAIGYIGVFFGKLIKSAVSRQREFLADASSVQFTRNPEGIAGALKKIMGLSLGSRIEHVSAEEASHLFFSNALTTSWFSLMATHPPLPERIKRIDPSFTGAVETVRPQRESEDGGISFLAGAAQQQQPPPPVPSCETAFAAHPAHIMGQVGAPRAEHIEYAANLIGSLPDGLLGMLREVVKAQAVVYALLVSKQDEVKHRQIAYLAGHADARVHASTLTVLPLIEQVGTADRIPVVDLALPALRQMSDSQYEEFRTNVLYLASADMEIDLFEYTLMRILVRNLDPIFKGVKSSGVKYNELKQVSSQCATILATLARFGSDDEDEVAKGFADGMNVLSLESSAAILSQNQCSLDDLDKALDALIQASAAIKKQLINACATCIASDGRTTLEEAELLRAIADSLDCPIPPILNAIAA
jgi:Zn-dependent protease with chaperone function